MNAKTVRENSTAELREILENSVEEMFNLRFQGTTEEIKNPAQIRKLRRLMARIKTILKERGEPEAAPKLRAPAQGAVS